MAMAEEDGDDDTLSQFLSVTGGSVTPSTAQHFLEMSGNRLDVAVGLLMDANDERDDGEGSGGLDVVAAAGLYDLSDPGCDHLADHDGDDLKEGVSDVGSSPDYDHLCLGFEDGPSDTNNNDDVDDRENAGHQEDSPDDDGLKNRTEAKPKEATERPSTTTAGGLIPEQTGSEGVDYILGTLVVRVLQAKHLRSDPRGGGGIAGLLSEHRRLRQQQRMSISPASGGNLTPRGNERQVHARLSFRGQLQSTAAAFEHARGDWNWSRGEQCYFDVTCPSPPLGADETLQQTPSIANDRPNNARQPERRAPILQLSLYSKVGISAKQSRRHLHKNSDNGAETNDDYLIGKCSINVQKILTGKTPYFDEWCTLHNDIQGNNSPGDEAGAGRVRVVVEYEPTDAPPQPGDTCIIADVYPLADELYPIPLWSIRQTSDSVLVLPKTYQVEEVVGDHVILSYRTPHENWQCTFEVHRRLLLCVERHQPVVEKYREQVLDLCDNLSQSPAVGAIVRTVETLPDEGLVYAGADLVKGSVDLMGKWWEKGVEGIVEDVVDGINLDGRHSRVPEDEISDDSGSQSTSIDTTQQWQADDRKAPPGMPACAITGLPMVEPVVAADGHTYERRAITRWLQSSDRSPLTGEILAHSELVPNYLLLSSLGDRTGQDSMVEHVDIL